MKRQSIKKALILSFTTLLMTQCGGNEDVIDNTDKSTVNTSQAVSSSIEIDTTDYDFEFVPPSTR